MANSRNRNYHVPKTGPVDARPTCFVCYRPTTHCVCNFVAPFKAHCNILILQHPHERKKYYSTTKLVARAVENSKILRGIEFEQKVIEQALAGQKAHLLYPSAEAVDCEAIQLDSDSTVVVIDGTWSEAGKIVFRNEFLKTLPCLTFKQPIRSNYRIRKQPKENYLSTLESIGHLLKLNAAAAGLSGAIRSYDSLFDGFSRMIEQQLSHWPTRATPHE